MSVGEHFDTAGKEVKKALDESGELRRVYTERLR